jgi:hypothetical protein
MRPGASLGQVAVDMIGVDTIGGGTGVVGTTMIGGGTGSGDDGLAEMAANKAMIDMIPPGNADHSLFNPG